MALPFGDSTHINAAMNSDSMISEEGSLTVSIPESKVTFFDLLFFSRMCRGEDGGWNFKSYWKNRGLDKIATPQQIAVEKWTKRSLAGPLPELRKQNFRFSRLTDVRIRAGTNLKLEADEDALNTALFQAGTLTFKDRKIMLRGYEIPLAANSKLVTDLLGHSSCDAIEVVELKQSSGKDSPLMALIEAIVYGIQIVRLLRSTPAFVSEFLDAATLDPSVNRSSFSPRSINLTVLAPSGYWDYWIGKSDAVQMDPGLQDSFQRIIQGVNGALEKGDPKLNVFFETLDHRVVQNGSAPRAGDARYTR